MNSKRWKELKGWQKFLIVDLALTQIGLFAASWFDLNRRLPENVNGRKELWRAALFLNGIGPLAYLTKGRVKSEWQESDTPIMTGKVVIVTGANRGIGVETARVLAQRGATVIMACRNLEKAHRAAEQIERLNPVGELVVMALDLADLDSVRSFAAAFKERFERLDLLINNAGIMVRPFDTTKQGFESQFGTNHLGHFALTGLLLDVINETGNGRVVTVSSIAHRFGEMDFNDLNWQSREYDKMKAYGQSKLANLLFTFELQRRLEAAGHDTIAVAAHPGYTATNTNDSMSKMIAQEQTIGALPTLYAATSDKVQGGDFIGPSGWGELGGTPQRVQANEAAQSEADARLLWEVSETLTGVSYPLRLPV